MADDKKMHPEKWQRKELLSAPSVADIDIGKLSESNPWFQYLAVIGPEDRSRVADILANGNPDTAEGLIGVLQSLLVELFRGTIHPAMIEAAKPLLDHMYAVVALKNAGANQSSTTFREFTARLVEVKQAITLQPVQAHYSIDAEPPAPARDRVVVEAKGG